MRVGLLACLVACGSSGSSPKDGGVDGAAFDAAPSGRACESSVADDAPTLVATPALDCVSRMCLHVQDQPLDHCTARCERDTDCIADPATSCTAGFRCVPVITTGPFACQKLCVCADRVPATACAR